MQDNKKRISASEVNKFTYCPYQWYYGRKYGASNLLRIAKQHKNIDTVQKQTNNFERGNKFHSDYHHKYKHEQVKRTIIIIIAVIIVMILISIII
ncbi:MAG: hypothetical protein ATN35_11815 [Epulopiscium sp. Nele67-Bin004]|nr:MAG: hypothetical protein ATN35_11815 [Epulopiscium sp. Nele67-Bin004]